MGSGIYLGRRRGTRLYVDWSCVLVWLLAVWYLAVVMLPWWNSSWGRVLTWALAFAGGLGLFLSVLIHEAAHGRVARAHGVPTQELTLYPFGGVTDTLREPRSPIVEFLIAASGPLANVALGLVCLLLSQASAAVFGSEAGSPYGVVGRMHPVPALALLLGSVNLFLSVVNLLPAFPLDGGRILRASYWAGTGNLRTATRWASALGQALGWLSVLVGLALVFGGRLPLVGTGVVNGLWLLFGGWFVAEAARRSVQRVRLRDLLQDVPVARLMRQAPPTAQANISIRSLVLDRVMTADEEAFPVLDGGRLVGIVTIDDARRVPRYRWEAATVREVMTGLDRLTVTLRDADVATALEKMTAAGVGQLPVVQDGSLVGMLRHRDLIEWLEARDAC